MMEQTVSSIVKYLGRSSETGVMFYIPNRKQWKLRTRGTYRYKAKSRRALAVKTHKWSMRKQTSTHLIGEGVEEEVTRLCIDEINKTRND